MRRLRTNICLNPPRLRRVLEKQKAKRVVIEDVGYDRHYDVNVYACKCPDCGLHLIEFSDNDIKDCDSDEPSEMFYATFKPHAYMGLHNFCNRCGRKLYWEDDDGRAV